MQNLTKINKEINKYTEQTSRQIQISAGDYLPEPYSFKVPELKI
jgi:hypothetical protein